MWLIWYLTGLKHQRDCYILWTNPLNLSQCQLSVVIHIPCHLTVYFFFSALKYGMCGLSYFLQHKSMWFCVGGNTLEAIHVPHSE